MVQNQVARWGQIELVHVDQNEVAAWLWARTTSGGDFHGVSSGEFELRQAPAALKATHAMALLARNPFLSLDSEDAS